MTRSQVEVTLDRRIPRLLLPPKSLPGISREVRRVIKHKSYLAIVLASLPAYLRDGSSKESRTVTIMYP